MDRITPEQRSKVMAAIRSRDTKPEMLVRRWLHAHGYHYRVCDRRIVGHPDIVIPRLRTLIEVRGCFWHRHGWEWDGRRPVHVADCRQATMPKSNLDFWNAKFRANVRRDFEHEKLWAEEGWNLIVVWECALLTNEEREKTFASIEKSLKRFGSAK